MSLWDNLMITSGVPISIRSSYWLKNGTQIIKTKCFHSKKIKNTTVTSKPGQKSKVKSTLDVNFSCPYEGKIKNTGLNWEVTEVVPHNHPTDYVFEKEKTYLPGLKNHCFSAPDHRLMNKHQLLDHMKHYEHYESWPTDVRVMLGVVKRRKMEEADSYRLLIEMTLEQIGCGLEYGKWCNFEKDKKFCLQTYVEATEFGELIMAFHKDAWPEIAAFSNYHGYYDGTYNIGCFYDQKDENEPKFSLVSTGTLYIFLMRTPTGGVPIGIFFCRRDTMEKQKYFWSRMQEIFGASLGDMIEVLSTDNQSGFLNFFKDLVKYLQLCNFHILSAWDKKITTDEDETLKEMARDVIYGPYTEVDLTDINDFCQQNPSKFAKTMLRYYR